MPDLVVGQPVAPVREFGPEMIAPGLEDPEGSLQRTIDIQHHDVKGPSAKVNPNNRSVFSDGTPRVGYINKYSYSEPSQIEGQTPCILDIVPASPRVSCPSRISQAVLTRAGWQSQT
eukprot:11483491-Alexandrium_andersonii.AAC.1